MSPRRSNAERTEATRAQLIRTARQLFGEHGYSATTIAEIAGGAGLTTGALYHHWPGKEALLVDVVHDIHRELAVRVRAAGADRGAEGEPVPLLLRSGLEFLGFCADPAVARLLLLDAPAVLGYERWRRIDEQWWLSSTVRLVERARSARGASGLGAADAGAAGSRRLALALLGALTYLGHEVAMTGAATVADAGRTYEVLLRSLLC
ncbi:TetR/AcrR family transcriptional regulator [Streptomyces sp. NRRL B-1347]|uniref:TetR/AcrR family transcriptional regulator n=1 Tax=Streptomyces sp. NRRL B-1347 TaxID=1476877 RepID=UPI00069129C8|nr:TetR/AcrR family transcriptional regulator [Streptomyces sp. NRRL B-1347]